MLGGDSALEEDSSLSEDDDFKGQRCGVPHGTVSRGLSVVGILEPKPK